MVGLLLPAAVRCGREQYRPSVNAWRYLKVLCGTDGAMSCLSRPQFAAIWNGTGPLWVDWYRGGLRSYSQPWLAMVG